VVIQHKTSPEDLVHITSFVRVWRECDHNYHGKAHEADNLFKALSIEYITCKVRPCSPT
jgi:hypothetical protein